MSTFRLLIEETLGSIKARKLEVNRLYNYIKDCILNDINGLIQIYNEDKTATLTINDNQTNLNVEISYEPELVKDKLVTGNYDYNIKLNNENFIGLYLAEPILTKEYILNYINSSQFETTLKHELLHYLDTKQSKYKIEFPDYNSIPDDNKLYKVYYNRPEEIHALLYSVIDLLKDKNIKFNSKEELVNIIKNINPEIGESLYSFLFIDGKPSNVNKFMNNLINSLK